MSLLELFEYGMSWTFAAPCCDRDFCSPGPCRASSGADAMSQTLNLQLPLCWPLKTLMLDDVMLVARKLFRIRSIFRYRQGSA